MECKEAKKLAKSLLENCLTKEKQRQLFFHIKNCKNCYDDLSKEYLLFSILEDKSNKNNYDGNFNKVVDNIRSKITNENRMKIIVDIADTLIIWAVIISIISTIAIAWKY